ncbi:glycosyltransferase [Nocardia bovistercoris]|uniref:Glycosyltransferase family 1 protein n=1 Tax=Nocardia bovistercoris TaxID=2785916 RepID=A0A931N3T5_9NOCA|nr:glycosyltransferase [Nocardia bovistercoris]MBH0780995.1 glycosyltransferase family 1 protein [Nocardia bovistercoris]
MKIIFSSLSGYGHIYPLLPLAIAARAAGHDVVYATGEKFHPLLLGLGFRTVSVGIPIHDAFGIVFGEPEGKTGKRLRQDWLEPAARAFNEVLPRRFATDLMPVLRAERPDLVVYEAGNPGAGLAARRCDIPALCHSNAQADAIDREDADGESGRHGDDRTAAGVSGAAASAVRTLPWVLAARQWRQRGMTLLHEVAAEVGVELSEGHYLLGDRYLDIYPSSLQESSFLDRPERVPLRPMAFGESSALPRIVAAERKRPLVYLTLGTTVGTARALRTTVEGVSALDVDVVVAAGPNISLDDLGAFPGNVHLEGWVPQADLLPLVDLVVHHGGSGTTLAAAAVALPQLFLPIRFDGFLNASAVAATGAGKRLLPDEVDRDEQRRAHVVSAAVVAEAAAELLTDPDARRAAENLAAEIAAMPGPAELVTRLTEFL